MLNVIQGVDHCVICLYICVLDVYHAMLLAVAHVNLSLCRLDFIYVLKKIHIREGNIKFTYLGVSSIVLIS